MPLEPKTIKHLMARKNRHYLCEVDFIPLDETDVECALMFT